MRFTSPWIYLLYLLFLFSFLYCKSKPVLLSGALTARTADLPCVFIEHEFKKSTPFVPGRFTRYCQKLIRWKLRECRTYGNVECTTTETVNAPLLPVQNNLLIGGLILKTRMSLLYSFFFPFSSFSFFPKSCSWENCNWRFKEALDAIIEHFWWRLTSHSEIFTP